MIDESKAKLPAGTYIVLGGDEPDEKGASFRLMGDALDPDAITQATGLTPSTWHRKGEPRPASRTQLPPWRSGLWSLTSDTVLPRKGPHLEEHLGVLLDQLEPVREVLDRLRVEQDLEADFFCGYHMHQSNSGFALSPDTLARIAALGATFGVDIYGPDPDDDDRMHVEE